MIRDKDEIFDPTAITIDRGELSVEDVQKENAKSSQKAQTEKKEEKKDKKEGKVEKKPQVEVKKEAQPKDISESIKNLAKYWKEKGFISPDFDVDAEISKEALLNSAYEHTLKKAVEAGIYEAEQEVARKRRELGLDDATWKVAAIFGQGGDPRFLDEIYVINQFLNLKIEDNDEEEIDERNQEAVIRKGLMLEGKSQEDIDDEIEFLFEKGKGLAKAKKYKKILEARRDALIEEKDKARIGRIKKDESSAERFEKIAKAVITNNKDLWNVSAEEFIKDIFSKTEFVQGKDVNGKPFTTKATKIQLELYNSGIRIEPIYPADEKDERFLKYIKALHDFLYGKTKKKESDDLFGIFGDKYNKPTQTDKSENKTEVPIEIISTFSASNEF